MIGTGIMLVLALGEWPRKRSGMSDLHEARTPNPNAGIDAIGLLFSALVAAIVVRAGVIAYEAIDTRPNAPVTQMVAR